MTEDGVSSMFLERKVNLDQPKSPRRRLQKSAPVATNQSVTKSYSAVAASTVAAHAKVEGDQSAKIESIDTKNEKKEGARANASASSSGERRSAARRQKRRDILLNPNKNRMRTTDENGAPEGFRARGHVCYNCYQTGHFASSCPGNKRGPGGDIPATASSSLKRKDATDRGQVGWDREPSGLDASFVGSTAESRRQRSSMQSEAYDKMLRREPPQAMREWVGKVAGAGSDAMHARFGTSEARRYDGFYGPTPDLHPRPTLPSRSYAWAGASLSAQETRWDVHGHHAHGRQDEGQGLVLADRPFVPARSRGEMPTEVRGNGLYHDGVLPAPGQSLSRQAFRDYENRQSAQYYYAEPQRDWFQGRWSQTGFQDAHVQDEYSSHFEYSRPVDYREREARSRDLQGPNRNLFRQQASTTHIGAHHYAREDGGERARGNRHWGQSGNEVGRHEFHSSYEEQRRLQGGAGERDKHEQARYGRSLPTSPRQGRSSTQRR